MTQATDANPTFTIVGSTTSTNDDARDLARSGCASGSAVVAHAQTEGRGRRGHTWSSPQGGLYVSVVVRPRVPMRYLTGLPIVAALGVLKALREDAKVPDCSLKWPNDLLLGEGKLGGILVEAGGSEFGSHAVIGVGINMSAPDDAGAVGIGGDPMALAPAYLQEHMPTEGGLGFEELAHALVDRIMGSLAAWEDDVQAGKANAGPLAPILGEYFDVVPYLGHQVMVLDPAGAPLMRGMFCGVDCWGRATVRDAFGSEVEFAAEQASIRLM